MPRVTGGIRIAGAAIPAAPGFAIAVEFSRALKHSRDAEALFLESGPLV